MSPALRGSGLKASRGFEPRSLDSESRVLTVTPRGQVIEIDLLGHMRSSQVTYRNEPWEATPGP